MVISILVVYTVIVTGIVLYNMERRRCEIKAGLLLGKWMRQDYSRVCRQRNVLHDFMFLLSWKYPQVIYDKGSPIDLVCKEIENEYDRRYGR